VVRLVLSLLAAALLAAPAGASDQSSSGIAGLVLRGPTQPVCTVGVRCEGPAADAALAVTKSSRIVARTRTNEQGRFRLALAPGRYTVITTGARIGQMAPSVTVRVRAGAYARVTLHIDTGIR
jgi:hypothetical protein